MEAAYISSISASAAKADSPVVCIAEPYIKALKMYSIDDSGANSTKASVQFGKSAVAYIVS